ncbi:MAG: hypothetical protein ABIC57_02900, partial [bacterium]
MRLKRIKFCECGCGSIISDGNRFKCGGHYFKGKLRPEVGRKVSETKKNNFHPTRGKRLPKWWRNKISEGWRRMLNNLTQEEKEIFHKKLSDNQKGERCSNWQGGKSFELYGVEFDDELKEKIRERDGHVCILCG